MRRDWCCCIETVFEESELHAKMAGCAANAPTSTRPKSTESDEALRQPKASDDEDAARVHQHIFVGGRTDGERLIYRDGDV